MTENLILSVRTTENGFLASFGDTRHPGEMGKEFVATTSADLRTTLAAEVEKRLGDMIDRLSKRSS
ncbi:hypothetical protein [Marinibacterium sp. SX1]|uniref:hypothetical protein n=1 Tax=Marinibacterium sp. SX1 TaxID=3388424 RepID=UPI003D16BBB8